MLNQDPDLEQARFDILDFSAPRYGESRELKIIDADAIPRVSEDRKAEMLSIFAHGYFRAKETLREDAAGERNDTEQSRRDTGPEQPGFFDGEP